MLECTQDWTVGISNFYNVDDVYIDFSKAFDSIVFSKLLTKIENCGITGKLLDWTSACVHNRTQCVVLQNCFSSVSDVVSGVPQGSVSGPILFLMFKNDVDSVIFGNTVAKMFAGDLKLYTVYKSVDKSLNLQKSIDNLISWSKLWQPTKY